MDTDDESFPENLTSGAGVAPQTLPETELYFYLLAAAMLLKNNIPVCVFIIVYVLFTLYLHPCIAGIIL